MGLFDFLKNKKAERDERIAETDNITNLTLKTMKPGYLVDYDLTTWQVTGAHRYDFGGDVSLEWQITSADTTLYLQVETDDEDYWSLSRPLAIGSLGDVRQHIIDNDDPPEEITHDGVTYYMEESAGGYYYHNGQARKDVVGQEMLSWSYVSEDESRLLSIEQWGETEFKAYIGHPVQEYQFTNILPGA